MSRPSILYPKIIIQNFPQVAYYNINAERSKELRKDESRTLLTIKLLQLYGQMAVHEAKGHSGKECLSIVRGKSLFNYNMRGT